MTITNGYTTLADFKNLKSIVSTDSVDDGVIENLIEQASRIIDTETGRTFYARTETRYYNVPYGRQLIVDDDLLAVTKLTNGDGTEILATDYYLMPRNVSPKYAIVLKEMSGAYWTADSSGNTEYVIPVEGSWGYSATTPADIRRACEGIVLSTYQNRYGQTVTGVATVTGAGVVITPKDIPAESWQIIRAYRRIV